MRSPLVAAVVVFILAFGVGAVTAQDFQTVEQREQKGALIKFDGGVSDRYGHSYFRTNPAVSSDIVLLLPSNRPIDPLAGLPRPTISLN